MDIMELLSGIINIAIPAVFSILIQTVKKLLEVNEKGFKKSENWMWVTIGAGLPMAIIDYGIKGFKGFNFWQFILMSGAYAAAATLMYKVAKVGGKSIGELLNGKDKENIKSDSKVD